ncbi:WG repeat-containing protein [uncultured Lacinutrix sp.]|uniref:WG repeat-containing protein n=1 Tax=uncultured Lacinutrix sp. TaxID=574032 RepID=UPI002610B7C3|nr:WG repeat-containing protein [uncultured Lacinutrix sp.]
MKTIKISLLTLVLIFSVTLSFAQKLALANETGKFGYINTSGEWHIEPQFKVAKNFSEDMAQASINGKKWGYINRKGEWVIEPKFKKTKAFNSGIAIVADDDGWMYINKKGERVFSKLNIEKFYDFSEGLAPYRQGKLVGFIDTNGEIIVEPKYIKAFDFLNGYSKVRVGDKWGLIDKTGAYFVKPEYDGVSKVYNSNKVVTAKKGEQNGLIINNEFKVIEGAEKIWNFSINSDLTYAKKGGKIGFINSKGEWVIKPKYDKARAFRNGLAPVFANKSWGYIDNNGETIIPIQYRDAEIFSVDGLAPVKSEKFWGFMDKNGEMVIDEKYDITAGGFSIFKKNNEKGFVNGLARVKYKKSWGFINKEGKLLKNMWFKNLELFY